MTQGKVAIRWRGNAADREAAIPLKNRLLRNYEALDARGIQAKPAVYTDERAEQVRAHGLPPN